MGAPWCVTAAPPPPHALFRSIVWVSWRIGCVRLSWIGVLRISVIRRISVLRVVWRGWWIYRSLRCLWCGTCGRVGCNSAVSSVGTVGSRWRVRSLRIYESSISNCGHYSGQYNDYCDGCYDFPVCYSNHLDSLVKRLYLYKSHRTSTEEK